MTSRIASRLRTVAALVALTLAAPVWSAPKSFGQADTAWHTADLEKAMQLYSDALAEGGLAPNEVVIAYSRIGTVKAALKDTNGALSAFRIAAAIDPVFELPADSGPAAKKLYERARKEAADFGGERLELTITAPETVPAQRPFKLETSIPEGFAVLVAEVVVTIEDPTTGKKWRRKAPAEAKVTFEFPKRVAIRGARLKITAAAVDGQNNSWTVAESKLKVEGVREIDAISDDPIDDQPRKKPEEKSNFLSLEGPLPWIVGGVLLVGGVIVFAATRPADEVNVGAPSWK